MQKTVTSYFSLPARSSYRTYNTCYSANHGDSFKDSWSGTWKTTREILSPRPFLPFSQPEEQNLPQISQSPQIPACHRDEWCHLRGSGEVDAGCRPPQSILLPWIRYHIRCETLSKSDKFMLVKLTNKWAKTVIYKLQITHSKWGKKLLKTCPMNSKHPWKVLDTLYPCYQCLA